MLKTATLCYKNKVYKTIIINAQICQNLIII